MSEEEKYAIGETYPGAIHQLIGRRELEARIKRVKLRGYQNGPELDHHDINIIVNGLGQYEVPISDGKNLGPIMGPGRTFEKPPLGVMPEKLFLHERIQELSRAISEYTKSDFELAGREKSVSLWAEELIFRLRDLKTYFKRQAKREGQGNE